MQVTSGIQCNLLSPSYSTIYAPRGDAKSRFVLIQLLEGAAPWEVPAGASVIIRAAKPDGTFCFYDTNEAGESAYSVSGSTVTIELVGQVLAAPGPVLMQIDFYNADGAHLSTFTFCCQVSESVVADDDIVSSNYFSVLTATLTEMLQIEQAVKAAYGAPLVAATAAAMTDHTRVYVYTGSESGYTNGNWYYWNGSAWASGGVYNSSAVNVDSAPTQGSTNPVSSGGTYTAIAAEATAREAADTALGDELDDVKSALDSYFIPPENYDRLTDKTALANKAFDQTGNIIDGGSLLFPMYIPVEPNTTYVGSGFNYYGSARGYGADKVFVANGATVDVKQITTGPDTHFIRFCVNNNATASSVVFQKGTAPSAITSLAQLSEDVAISDDEFKPFNLDNLTGNSKLAASAILAFEIHCTDPSAKVVLTRILKANSNVYAVAITVNGTAYNILNAGASNYAEPSYNEFNLQNVVYGYFVIDWSKLASGVAYNGINAELKQTYVKPYVETQKYQNVEILLPSTINVAVGHEISLEFYNIIYCSDINEYEILATPNNASFQNLGDRLRINPASSGDTTVTVSVYKNSVLITTKQTVVHAVVDTQPTIKALFLGDSMTAQGFYLAELKRMLGANLSLYGTRSSTAEDSTGNSQTVLNEGRAGWSTSNYINNASYGGVANPFYNNGFDFSYYMTNNPSFNDVTDVFILLGTNDGFGNGVETRYKTICDSIKAFNSNIRIHCMLPIPPIRSGYAFGIRSNNNYLTFKNYMFNTAKKYVSAFDGTEGYFIIPTNANLNCYYDFPQTEVAVNSRNPQLIAVGNDNVHPSKYGYYRFADVIYGDIIANCQ